MNIIDVMLRKQQAKIYEKVNKKRIGTQTSKKALILDESPSPSLPKDEDLEEELT